jgi:cobalt/nickel transport system permease protein
MHMADALVSPAVGGTMWVVSGGLIALCVRELKRSARDDLVPLMGVLGAFIFAAQMINFSIPGTGSSGHLGGGLVLAVLLGPYAAVFVISSVLVAQALFFGDGGLLALGCNIFNLGVCPAFLAYPLVYRPIAARQCGTVRAWAAAMAGAVVGLQAGALGVVLETKVSGIADLPFGTFLLLMLPIHLAIGVGEGLATAAVVAFIAKARPASLQPEADAGRGAARSLLVALAVAAVITGGVLSWFASERPDGLEWSLGKASGGEALEPPNEGIHRSLAAVQEKTAILPDYGFRPAGDGSAAGGGRQTAWPTVDPGTSVAGIVGGLLTAALVVAAGLALRRRTPPTRSG